MSGCTGNGMQQWGYPAIQSPTECGQLLFSVDGAIFEPALPLLDDDGRWIATDDDLKIVLQKDERP